MSDKCRHGIDMQRACPDCYTEARSFYARENDRLRGIIMAFCSGQQWADHAWKDQAHVKPLFDVANESRNETKKHL